MLLTHEPAAASSMYGTDTDCEVDDRHDTNTDTLPLMQAASAVSAGASRRVTAVTAAAWAASSMSSIIGGDASSTNAALASPSASAAVYTASSIPLMHAAYMHAQLHSNHFSHDFEDSVCAPLIQAIVCASPHADDRQQQPPIGWLFIPVSVSERECYRAPSVIAY